MCVQHIPKPVYHRQEVFALINNFVKDNQVSGVIRTAQEVIYNEIEVIKND